MTAEKLTDEDYRALDAALGIEESQLNSIIYSSNVNYEAGKCLRDHKQKILNLRVKLLDLRKELKDERPKLNSLKVESSNTSNSNEARPSPKVETQTRVLQQQPRRDRQWMAQSAGLTEIQAYSRFESPGEYKG